MKQTSRCRSSIIITLLIWIQSPTLVAQDTISVGEYTLVAGHPSLEIWSLPEPSYPPTNKPTKERIELGRTLFFDSRLSGDGQSSCASCHIPEMGWADGLPTATGASGEKLERTTPTIINSAYNYLQMWDGRFDSLEIQALSPLTNSDEMNLPIERLLAWLKTDLAYSEAFARAYPALGINSNTLSMAIASFERTVISDNSPFDQWARGDSTAMTESQINGFAVFLDENKGNCVVCHSPPNFSDNGYHNIGIESVGADPDNGRFNLVPISVMQGAFKTPTLRDIETTHPYFHNGTAQTLADVINHYEIVDNSTSTSPSLKQAKLNASERENLIDFLGALTDRQHLKAQHADITINSQPLQTESKMTPNKRIPSQ